MCISVLSVTPTLISNTWRRDKDGGGDDHTHVTIEGGPVESLCGEVNKGDGERGSVGDGDSGVIRDRDVGDEV